MFKVCLLSLLFVGVTYAEEPTKKVYTTKYDDIELDPILTNDRLYQRHFNCFAGKGPCTPEAMTLKDVLPDALQTACSKCNEKQKAGAEKVLRFVLRNKQEDFKVLEKKYDPTGEYRKKYEAEAEKNGIKLPN